MRTPLVILSTLLMLSASGCGSPVQPPRDIRGDHYFGKFADINGGENQRGDRVDIKLSNPAAKETDSQKESGIRQDKVKMLASRLEVGDHQYLKMLLEKAIDDLRAQDAISSQHNADSTGAEELGTFIEGNASNGLSRLKGAANDETKGMGDFEKDIMSVLHRFKQQRQSDPRGVQDREPVRQRSRQTIEEGHFGEFRQEVLHAVEDRLVSDLKMALHSGFSVKDIINDLETADGQWMDDSRQLEIKRELNQLASLGQKDNM